VAGNSGSSFKHDEGAVMPIPFEHLEAEVIAQFEDCKILASAYQLARSTYTADLHEVGRRLHREAVAFEKSLQSISESRGGHFELMVPCTDPEWAALMVTALMQMGKTPDRQTALRNFVRAMTEEEPR
jgi:hypothetical protein